jgi:hypothetical protein
VSVSACMPNKRQWILRQGDKRDSQGGQKTALVPLPSTLEGPEMKLGKGRTTPTRRYSIPRTRMEWTSERRDLLEIREPGPPGFQPGTNSDARLIPSELPDLPTPQREGLRLIDRSRGYEYTLKTHIVPAAWLRSTPDVGYPTGCGVGGLQERGGLSRVREEMLETKKRYLRGELPEGKDERQYWVCVNRYVRNRLEEKERKGEETVDIVLGPR